MTAPQGPLGLTVTEHGLALAALDLWLDPIGTVPPGRASFLSHVHAARALGPHASSSSNADPAAVHASIASPETLRLLRALDLAGSSGRPLGWGETQDMPIDASFGGGTARLATAPAGHVLGGAQLVIDHPRGRFVYAGDWSGDTDPTRPAGEVIPCDELVITSTFGLPLFRFDRLDRVLAALAGWCAGRLAEGKPPAVLVQTPGPAQLVARALTASGLPVVADDDVRRACDAYGELGRPIGPVGARGPNDVRSAIIAPASLRAADLGLPKRASVAYVSGWAVLDAAVTRKRADAAFGLADQADYDGLASLVSASGAKVVHVTRGHAPVFAHELARRGVDARAFDLAPIDDRAGS